MQTNYPFQLKSLPYDYFQLEPFISKMTLEYHHDKHLQAYTDNLNKVLKEIPELQETSLIDILKNLNNIPENFKTGIINNGGGVFNHNFYFDQLSPSVDMDIPESLKTKLIKDFSSVENFIEELKKAALGCFGSGWAWLVEDNNNNLQIITTKNQDTPFKDNLKPLLNLDVWEHAYYIDYQNRRAAYIDAFIHIINWDVVANRL